MSGWDKGMVKAALVDAFECDFDVGGRWKPKEFGSNMPEPVKDATDIWFQMMSGANTVGRLRAKLQRKASEITRMEIVLLGFRGKDGVHYPNWLGGMLPGLDGPRNCLTVHAVQSASFNLKGREFDAKRYCRRVGWSYSTYRSRRDRGAEIIAFRLNEIGLEPW